MSRDINGRIIDLMMSMDKVPDSPRKHTVMKALARSLDTKPPTPWYKRLFTRRG